MLKKLILCSIFLSLFIPKFAVAKEYIHPYNKILMKLYPRPQKFRFPEVPRITAEEALLLYRSGQAFFIHIGDAGGNVPGCLHLREGQAAKLDPNKLLRKIPFKYVILYCH